MNELKELKQIISANTEDIIAELNWLDKVIHVRVKEKYNSSEARN